jgi:hypothetical protein
MKIKHLLEGAEPKLPGAVSGIQIMTPQQFVAKSAAGEEPEPEKDVAEGLEQPKEAFQAIQKLQRFAQDNPDFTLQQLDNLPSRGNPIKPMFANANLAIDTLIQAYKTRKELGNAEFLKQLKDEINYFLTDRTASSDPTTLGDLLMHKLGKINFQQGVAEATGDSKFDTMMGKISQPAVQKAEQERKLSTIQSVADAICNNLKCDYDDLTDQDLQFIAGEAGASMYEVMSALGRQKFNTKRNIGKWDDKDINEQGVAEATKLPAQTRDLKGDELEAYLDRIRNQEKQKTDKYKMPYIHRSSVMGYYNEEGKKYNTDAIKAALKERPKALLKKNEKMKHSDGEQEQFFNIGFAALTGIALDENTNELIIVNTCPGAGSCKVDCFAMKGGKIQFQGPWLSDGRILTYLLNDPDGFFSQLKSEIEKEELKGKKGGYKVSIRWHDAGDFFSPEYAGLAFKLANELPNVQFYAYTKIAGVALGQKPKNFMINWSEGASTSQEKQVKAADPNLERTKNSRIVPSNLFYDLLVKDEKKNLVKGAEGQWQVIPDKLPELKQRIAKEYGISPNSILSYTEWDQKTQGGKAQTPVKYNVIITPGEPDITAKSSGVLSTLLLKH